MAGCQTKNYKEKLESLYNHTVPLIKSSELNAKLDDKGSVILLDIRSKKEYVVSHIDGAKLIIYDDFSQDDVRDLPKEAEVVVYCSVGYRSEKVGEQMLKWGFVDVKNLYGGIFQWKNEGFMVVDQDKQVTDSVHTYNRRWSKWLERGIKVY
jgi:rhodanese-related sulfurtransferase